MKLKAPVGQGGLPPVATAPRFDFVVAERPKYIPGSGPALAAITVMPPHDKDGFIIDKVQFSKQLRYLVGYEHYPQLKVSVEPQNILDWVSRHALEKWESDQYDAEEKRREEEELPALLRKEERLRKRLETMSRAAQGIDGKKLKRKRATARVPSVGGVGGYPELKVRRRPADRHEPKEQETFASPKVSQHPQQASLSTPPHGLADRVIIDLESNDEGSVDTDTAIDLQLNGLMSTAEPSRSGSELIELLDDRTRSLFASNQDTSGDESRNATTVNPKRHLDILPSPFSHHSAVAATSSLEALKIYENLERKKKQAVSPFQTDLNTPSKGQSSLFSSLANPSNAPLSISSQSSPSARSRTTSKTPEPLLVPEDVENDQDEPEYELHQILDEEIRYEYGQPVRYYLIDWVGNYDNSWEPEDNVSPEAIEHYKEVRGKKMSSVQFDDMEEDGDEQGLFVAPWPRDRKVEGGNGMAEYQAQGLVIDDDDDEDAEGEALEW
jgi:hypothetical protein